MILLHKNILFKEKLAVWNSYFPILYNGLAMCSTDLE